jgi:hypothetical protein
MRMISVKLIKSFYGVQALGEVHSAATLSRAFGSFRRLPYQNQPYR